MIEIRYIVKTSAILALVFVILGLTNEARAQTVANPILTLETDRLFSDSLFGRRVDQELTAEATEITRENRRIEAELVAEEQELTRKRSEMDPLEFRKLADQFDAKVQSIRRDQEAKGRAINEKREAARQRFLLAVEPVLTELMVTLNATVILERDTVLVSADRTDVTDLAIERVDVILGDGSQ